MATTKLNKKYRMSLRVLEMPSALSMYSAALSFPWFTRRLARTFAISSVAPTALNNAKMTSVEMV